MVPIFILHQYEARCRHGQGMDIDCTEVLAGLSARVLECTAAVCKGNEGHGPKVSLLMTMSRK